MLIGRGLLFGGAIGYLLSFAADKPMTRNQKWVKVPLWTAIFALLGIVVGHGNVPWSRTLTIATWVTVAGIFVGLLHASLSAVATTRRD